MRPDLRTPAFHLLTGTLVAAAVLLPVLMVWYPKPLLEASGTARLPLFVAVLAVVLGPLTAHVAARRSPANGARLRWKIGAAQAAVLLGCLFALYVQRPVYLVFTVDRFDLVRAVEIDPRDLAKAAREEYQHRPLGAPQYVAAVPPADPVEVQRILGIALDGGKDLQAYPQHYVPYEQQAQAALKRAKPVDILLARDDGAVSRLLEKAGRAPASVRFLPLRARKRDCVVLLDAASGMPLAVLAVDPW